MKLSAAARYFDRQVFADPFDHDIWFKGQLDLFDDAKRDGTTGLRRVVSVAPGTVLPSTGVIETEGQVYLVGERHDDVFNGSAIRSKYVTQMAYSAKLRTLKELAANSAGTTTYADPLWVKDLKEPDESSALYPFFNVFVPTALTVPISSVITVKSENYLVRTVFTSAGGFKECECNRLYSGAVATVSYTGKGGAYDPVQDVYASSAPASVAAVVLRYEDFFNRRYESAKGMEPGDMTLAVAKTLVATPKVGDSWTLNSRKYNVLSILDDGSTSWLLHSRHA